MCPAECQGSIHCWRKESGLGMVVVMGTWQFLLSLLLYCNQCENLKEGPSAIPLRALGMNTSPVCAGQDKLGWWSRCLGTTCLCVMLCPELVLLVRSSVNQIFSAGSQLSKTCPTALGALYQNSKIKRNLIWILKCGWAFKERVEKCCTVCFRETGMDSRLCQVGDVRMVGWREGEFRCEEFWDLMLWELDYVF